jgi:DNA polymerase-3 subunit gamma/tau
VFENIIEQGAALQLRDDILSGRLAPSMLFYGPSETGKGSAALELARVLSCEGDTSWKCRCPACESHRYLRHGDLLILGSRSFSAEIAASSSAFLREPSNQNTKTLFVRSLRKLQIRFSQVLMEADPKLGKISPLLQSLEEDLNELWFVTDSTNPSVPEKLAGSLVKDALKLESEGMSGFIPVGHIRRAAYWCRLAPNGKRKTLIIENADRMKEEARNSLLKLLEEPPDTVCIVLTSQRRESIMPTILSRLRPYRFLKRGTESEKEVIRRVFRDSANEDSPISAYLDSFLPTNTEKLYPLAAYFIASLARTAALSLKKKGAVIPAMINSLGERYAPIADEAGFERSVRSAVIIKTLLAEGGNFEDDAFSRFLKAVLENISPFLRTAENPQYIAYNEMFKKYTGEAETAVGVLNQSPALALEALFHKLKTALAGIQYE